MIILNKKNINKDHGQMTSEILIKNEGNRFEFVKSIIEDINGEIIKLKTNNELDNEINVVYRVLCEKFNSALVKEKDKNKDKKA